MLAHNVYFQLNDQSPPAVDTLVAACHKYLTDHPGIVSFNVGTLARGYERDVNDRDFDVALLIVFESRRAHDTYQQATSHQAFIDECKNNWKHVRVFDADISVG